MHSGCQTWPSPISSLTWAFHVGLVLCRPADELVAGHEALFRGQDASHCLAIASLEPVVRESLKSVSGRGARR